MNGDKRVDIDLGCGSFLICVFMFVIAMVALRGVRDGLHYRMDVIEEKIDSVIKTKEVRDE